MQLPGQGFFLAGLGVNGPPLPFLIQIDKVLQKIVGKKAGFLGKDGHSSTSRT
jgi:hypothetical protein